MNNYQEIILNHLYDKYERSVLSKQGSSLNLKIMVKIKTLFPKYDASDFYDQRVIIDRACKQLQSSDLILLEFDDDDIKSVQLNLDLTMIKMGYALIGREFKADCQNSALKCLQNITTSISWINRFRVEMITKLENFRSVNRYLLIDKDSDIIDIFNVLKALENQKEEVSFRKFSIMVLRDSKRLEELKSKVVNIINDFYEVSFDDEDELFSYFNVIKNPGFIYLKGNIKIKLYDQIIDVGALRSPFSLTTENINLLEIIEINGTNVLTVENLASFYDLNLNNTLIVYLGGYHNSLRRELLLKIYQFNHDLNYYHFGDIDAGGFYIYQHLVEKTKIPFKLLAMDKEVLIKYKHYTKQLTVNDRKRLIKLKENICDDTIDYMLENNCKLEQEIVVLDDKLLNN